VYETLLVFVEAYAKALLLEIGSSLGPWSPPAYTNSQSFVPSFLKEQKSAPKLQSKLSAFSNCPAGQRDLVGLEVGVSVGCGVGERVGTGDGILLGIDVGDALGRLLGFELGTGDGSGVGAGEGISVGTGDGTGDGTGLGNGVGNKVGNSLLDKKSTAASVTLHAHDTSMLPKMEPSLTASVTSASRAV